MKNRPNNNKKKLFDSENFWLLPRIVRKNSMPSVLFQFDTTV